ncbi:MAG: DUF5329 domain-containing protein [Chthoniobacterales bacterium]
MRRFLLTILPLFLLMNVLCARDAREDQRIEYLLQSVASMKGGVFIRNGSEYSASEAVAHLKLKLSKGGERVKTAEDFIAGCASKSSFSGTPYQIRLPDGKTVETGPYFLGKLREFDRDHPKQAAK